jgi:hypothetical protein
MKIISKLTFSLAGNKFAIKDPRCYVVSGGSGGGGRDETVP